MFEPGTRVKFGETGRGIVAAEDNPGIPFAHRTKPDRDGLDFVYVFYQHTYLTNDSRFKTREAEGYASIESERNAYTGGWYSTDLLTVVPNE